MAAVEMTPRPKVGHSPCLSMWSLFDCRMGQVPPSLSALFRTRSNWLATAERFWFALEKTFERGQPRNATFSSAPWASDSLNMSFPFGKNPQIHGQ